MDVAGNSSYVASASYESLPRTSPAFAPVKLCVTFPKATDCYVEFDKCVSVYRESIKAVHSLGNIAFMYIHIHDVHIVFFCNS